MMLSPFRDERAVRRIIEEAKRDARRGDFVSSDSHRSLAGLCEALLDAGLQVEREHRELKQGIQKLTQKLQDQVSETLQQIEERKVSR